MGQKKSFPGTVVIIGAGVFGLSTALAIAKRHPSTKITIVDRLTPPVLDGSSVDTTRCIRSDYADPVYGRLAKESQKRIMADPDLSRYTFTQGMTYACDGHPSRFTETVDITLERAKKQCRPEDVIVQETRQEVYERIHGKGSQPPPLEKIGGKSRWNRAYTNLEAAFIDAKECVQIYYDRCVAVPSIECRFGSAVDRIEIVEKQSKGVVLENGSKLSADMVIVAAGAWSPKLVSLGTRLTPIGHEVAWIKVTPEEEARWKHMSISTNMSTGINLFPPYNGEIKILRRSPGYRNMISVPQPEDRSKRMEICYPRTQVTNPEDMIPADAEAALRENLREIMPDVADRPFARTKICWLSITPTADFLIAPHPSVAGIHLATAGSAHGWKFLPLIGDWVVDSIQKTLPQELVEKWAFHKVADGKDQSSPRVDGEPQDINQVIRYQARL